MGSLGEGNQAAGVTARGRRRPSPRFGPGRGYMPLGPVLSCPSVALTRREEREGREGREGRGGREGGQGGKEPEGGRGGSAYITG